MLLGGKVAVVYGAGGSIGGAGARAFARQGAALFMAGRSQVSLDQVAESIPSKGLVQSAVVDALDEQAVDGFVDEVARQTGQIDISFNAISLGDVQKSLSEISVDDFSRPIITATRTEFLTMTPVFRKTMWRAAALVAATLDDFGNVAAFVASDRARTITGPRSTSQQARSWTEGREATG